MASAFRLALGEVLQGEVRLDVRTLLLVFQVNCPGCFQYVLPLAEEVHGARADGGMAVLGISTAFEDFDLNSVENTRALLDVGTVVGETRESLGTDRYGGRISFPVAADAGMDEAVGETFATNRLRGTPSWIILEPDGEVLAHHFGRLPVAEAPRS